MKEETKPMERLMQEPLPLRLAPRCLARTRTGSASPEGRVDGPEALPDARRGKGQRRAPVSGTAVIATGSSPAKRSASGALSGLIRDFRGAL